MERKYTKGEYLNALAMLESASVHIASQFSMSMTRDQAKHNLDTRHLLLRHRVRTHNEAAGIFGFKSLMITNDDLAAAAVPKDGAR